MDPSRFLGLGCALVLVCSAGCAADGGVSTTEALLDAPSFEVATTTSTTVDEVGGWPAPFYGYPCGDDPYPGGSTIDFEETIGFFAFAPVQWGISLDDPEWGPGVHTLYMVVEVQPVIVEAMAGGHAEEVSGRLVWDETVVELCGIGIRCVGEDYLHVGDIFQTVEGCGDDPSAMQEAFDKFGMPREACVSVGSDGVDHEYCAPLRARLSHSEPPG